MSSRKRNVDIYKILENRLKYICKTDVSKHIVVSTLSVPLGSYVYYLSMPNRILVIDTGTLDARSEEDWLKVGREAKEYAKPIYIFGKGYNEVGVKELIKFEDTKFLYETYTVHPVQINKPLSTLNPVCERIVKYIDTGEGVIQLDTNNFRQLCIQLNRIGKELDRIYGIDREFKRYTDIVVKSNSEVKEV